MRSRHRKALQFLRSILLIASILPLSIATPVSPESEFLDLNNVTLAEKRAVPCPNGVSCGIYGQYCCNYSERCYTNINTIALCTPVATPAPAPSSGHWEYYTRTVVVTNRVTMTKVYSSFVGGWTPATPAYYTPAAASTTQKPIHCAYRQNPCGPICCKSWQFCVVPGQCGGSPPGMSFTPPLRPTFVGSVVITRTIPHTTTVGFQPAIVTGHHHHGGGVTISEDSSSGGLSAGAIAGIVIGVIIAIIILIILCLILCFGAAWNAVLAFFGLGRRRRRETVEVEEFHRHGSRADGRQYYGSGQPGRRPPPPRKKKGGFGWGTVILGLGALWAALGFRRRQERRRRDEKSESSNGYYSDYTASSSDRRTRDTRRSSRRDG